MPATFVVHEGRDWAVLEANEDFVLMRPLANEITVIEADQVGRR